MTRSTPEGLRERLERMDRYLAADPDNWSLRGEVFGLALEAGDLARAGTLVEQALRERPTDPVWLHRRSSWLLAQRRYGEAREALEDLLGRGVTAPAVTHDLAFAIFRLGDAAGAASRLEPLLGHPDEDAERAWTLWLRCQHRLERTRDALVRFRTRIAGGPVAAETLGVASLMAIDAGSPSEADAWSTESLKERPEQPEALVARGTLALGSEDATQAQRWFERALHQVPEDGRTWSGMAVARMMAGDLAGAEEGFGRAVATMPDHLGSWVGRGWCLLLLNRPDDARAVFEDALRIDRAFSETHGGLAVALARLDDREGAMHELEVTRRLDPGSLAAKYAEAVLAGKAEDPETIRALTNLAATRGPRT